MKKHLRLYRVLSAVMASITLLVCSLIAIAVNSPSVSAQSNITSTPCNSNATSPETFAPTFMPFTLSPGQQNLVGTATETPIGANFLASPCTSQPSVDSSGRFSLVGPGTRIPLVKSTATQRLIVRNSIPIGTPIGGAGQVAFAGSRAGSFNNIFVMNADGTGSAQPLIQNSTLHYIDNLSQSRATGKLLFRAFDINTGIQDLYVLDPSVGTPINITHNPSWFDYPGASWSPDGTKISFGQHLNGSTTSDIMVANADGSNVQLLEIPLFGMTGNFPAWSPDGTQIAFLSTGYYGYYGNVNIWTIHPDGTTPIQITSLGLGLDQYYPLSWSPDSTQIAYSWAASSTDRGIYTTDLHGNFSLHIPNVLFPSWSPDGFQFAYALTPSVIVSDLYGNNQIEVRDNSISAIQSPTWFQGQISPTVTPTLTPTWIPTMTSTGAAASPCSIAFATKFSLREKGNLSGAVLVSATVQSQPYPAYFKSSPSLDGGQVWVQILANQKIGWIQAIDQHGANLVDQTVSGSQNCFGNLPVYQGNFPAGWDQIARIDASDVTQAGNALAYLYSEGQRDPGLTLARLAIAESGRGLPRSQVYSEADYVAWTVRMRAFMGLINYGTTTRAFQASGQIESNTGKNDAGSTVDVIDDIIFSALQAKGATQQVSDINFTSPGYQPIASIANYRDPQISYVYNDKYPAALITDPALVNIAAGFYPLDVFDVEDLYTAYVHAQKILNIPWNSYNGNLMGYDTWIAGKSQPSSRANPPAGTPTRYPIRSPLNQPNGQNSFYDWYDLDDYFFKECVLQQNGWYVSKFPGSPFSIYEWPVGSGFYQAVLPTPPVACQ